MSVPWSGSPPALLPAEVPWAQVGAPLGLSLSLPFVLEFPKSSWSPQEWCPTSGKSASCGCWHGQGWALALRPHAHCPALLLSLWPGLLPPSNLSLQSPRSC